MPHENSSPKPLAQLFTFLTLIIVFSTIGYVPIIQEGSIDSLRAKLFAIFLLATPGLAAIITCLFFERSIASLGWRLPKIQYLLLGAAIPLFYCMVSYGSVWLMGWGQYNGQFPDGFLLLVITTLLLSNPLMVLPEEMGWRGFLVPKLMKVGNFTTTVIISGLIWAWWHYPQIIFLGVSKVPLAYSLVTFTIYISAVGCILAWLQLKTRSLWPAVLLHASHNLCVMDIFNPLTTNTGKTWFLVGEYGALSAFVALLLGIIAWRLQQADAG